MADTGPPWNLRFPGPQDFVRETNFYIEDLAEDTATALSEAGRLRQFVSATTTTQVTSTSTSYVTTGLEADITPTRDDSKIILIATVNATTKRDSSSGQAVLLRVDRNATTIQTWIRSVFKTRVDVELGANVSLQLVDDPETTSTLTYDILFAASNTSDNGTSFVQKDGNPSTLLLLEVAP